MLTGDWVKPYRIGNYMILFSKAPFYFSRWLPRIRRRSIGWRRYEIAVLQIMPEKQLIDELDRKYGPHA